MRLRFVAKRVELYFAPGIIVEFTDRDRGVRLVYEIGERGTRFPLVVFGPEGCGKSAWLKQAAEMLRELNYDVIYVDVLHKELTVHSDVRETIKRTSDIAAEASGLPAIKLADLVVVLAGELVKKWRRKRIALLIDELSWINKTPLEKDPDVGIGRELAWQTPLYREAVKRALGRYK